MNIRKHIKTLTLIASLVTSHFYADPLLVAVLMVKNEEPVIVQTLQPLVEGGIDAFVIFDTGSTDATIDKARTYFEQSGVTQFHIFQEPFVDFSVSRNRAFDLARECFPDSEFMIMLDAEWFLQNVPALLTFCKEQCADTEPGYLVRIISEGVLDYYNCRLVRTKARLQFKCPVHEYIDYIATRRVPESIYFLWNSTKYGQDKSARRWIRDRDVLLKQYHEDPQDLRTLFYLGQTYTCLNDLEQAIHYYTQRLAINGWGEEAFESCCRLAYCIEKLALSGNESYSWPQAQYYYLKAHSMRASRAEPLVRIAAHYLAEDNHRLAFLFANRAADLEYPHGDLLFIDKEIYTFTRYDILGRSAWYIGEYDRGEWALRQALCNHGDRVQLHNNLSFYIYRNIDRGKYGVSTVEIQPTAESLEGPLVWSILICTITERKDQLDGLLAELIKQIHANHLEKQIEILLFSDNRGDCPIGMKRNYLLSASRGTYINFIDDDDMVDKNYIAMIYNQLHSDVDSVSLVGVRTENGNHPELFVHSIEYSHWFAQNGVYYRPPNHLNPLKRDKVIAFRFPEVFWGEDIAWSMAIAQSGCIKTEAKITEPYYFYNYRTK